jgi:hypothetical protein
LALTDHVLDSPGPIPPVLAARLAAVCTPDEIHDAVISASVFCALSKLLIALGLEPESMDTTVLATPGSSS